MKTIAKKLKMTQFYQEDRAIGATPLQIIGDEMGDFEVGDKVAISGTSKGKGFQGVVKRHGFSGGPKSHGQKDRHRAPGSVGATGPAHVIKGLKMAGRMGGVRVTIKNLKVISIDPGKKLILIQGATPGNTNTRVEIKK